MKQPHPGEHGAREYIASGEAIGKAGNGSTWTQSRQAPAYPKQRGTG
jgi:hypothetical protein